MARAQPDGYTLVLANTSKWRGPQSRQPARFMIRSAISKLFTISAMAPACSLFTRRFRRPPLTRSWTMRNRTISKQTVLWLAGVGTTNPPLAGEMFKLLTKTPDIVHIPVGAGPLLSDLIGGQILFASMVMTGQCSTSTGREVRVLGRRHLSGPCSGRTRLSNRHKRPGFPAAHHAKSVRLFARREHHAQIVEQRQPRTEPTSIAGPGLAAALCRVLDFEPDLIPAEKHSRNAVEDASAPLTPIIKGIGLKLD